MFMFLIDLIRYGINRCHHRLKMLSQRYLDFSAWVAEGRSRLVLDLLSPRLVGVVSNKCWKFGAGIGGW
jgi:hypothetical protein